MEKLKYQYNTNKIVLQPTTLCNLNCSYCYLAERDRNLKMDYAISQKVADYAASFGNEITIIWHGGEPLTVGIDYFTKLIAPFKHLKNIRHCIQTNGILINDNWCDFFRENNINVGVSVDGDNLLNSYRLDWANNSSYQRTLNGIENLKKNQIKFHVISVITNLTVNYVKEFYDFFINLGCWSLGVNIEEKEGENKLNNHFENISVRLFWDELFNYWHSNPAIRIREFDNSLSWMYSASIKKLDEFKVIDIFPTISHNGDVVFLSPELLSAPKNKKYNFVSGNVKSQLLEIIIDSFMSSEILNDYKKGINKCREICPYFSFCGGGHASNKFYENGDLNSTETEYCKNSKKYLIDSIINFL